MKKRIVYLSLLSLVSIAGKHAYAMDPYGYIPPQGHGQYPQQGYQDPYGYHQYNQPPAHYGQEQYGYGYGSQGYPGYQHPAPILQHTQEEPGLSALHQAALTGDMDTVNYQLGRANMGDSPDAQGHNALWYAVEGDQPSIAAYLLNNHPTEYNVLTIGEASSGDTYLHRAKSPHMAGFLLSHGVPVNARNRAGMTALDLAFVAENRDLARTLINAGARVADQTGVLPMNAQTVIEAVYGANPVLVDILLGRINQLETTLQQQAPSGFLGGLLHLATGGTGAAANRAVEGLEPIFAAIQEGSIPAVALLILNGVNLDVVDAQHRTPAQLARANGQQQISALLHQVATARSDQERQTIARSFLNRYRNAPTEGAENQPAADIFAGIAGAAQLPEDAHTRLSYQHQAPTATGGMFGGFGGGSRN